MTAVVGLIDHQSNRILMGADRAINLYGKPVFLTNQPKVFKKSIGSRKMLMGVCGDALAVQFIHQSFILPPHEVGVDDYSYLSNIFSSHLALDLEEIGMPEFCLMLGYKGKLYRVEDDFYVGSYLGDYMAIGSGEPYSLGSLHSTNEIKALRPSIRVRMALEAATQFLPDVRPPYDILTL